MKMLSDAEVDENGLVRVETLQSVLEKDKRVRCVCWILSEVKEVEDGADGADETDRRQASTQGQTND